MPGALYEERLSFGFRVASSWRYICLQFTIFVPDNSVFVCGRFPFRILKGTVDLELQSKYRPSDFGGGKVLLCPDLLCPIIDDTATKKVQAEQLENIVRVKEPGRLSRLRRLAFIRERPVVKVCGGSRAIT